MGSGFAKRKKEARLLRESFEGMKDKMKNTSVTGSAGNGLVTVTLNGEHEVTALKIKPECVDKEDIEGLEDLVKAALNDAVKKLEKETPDFPGMSGLPGMF